MFVWLMRYVNMFVSLARNTYCQSNKLVHNKCIKLSTLFGNKLSNIISLFDCSRHNSNSLFGCTRPNNNFLFGHTWSNRDSFFFTLRHSFSLYLVDDGRKLFLCSVIFDQILYFLGTPPNIGALFSIMSPNSVYIHICFILLEECCFQVQSKGTEKCINLLQNIFQWIEIVHPSI